MSLFLWLLYESKLECTSRKYNYCKTISLYFLFFVSNLANYLAAELYIVYIQACQPRATRILNHSWYYATPTCYKGAVAIFYVAMFQMVKRSCCNFSYYHVLNLRGLFKVLCISACYIYFKL